jgi:hypothetical protein
MTIYYPGKSKRRKETNITNDPITKVLFIDNDVDVSKLKTKDDWNRMVKLKKIK